MDRLPYKYDNIININDYIDIDDSFKNIDISNRDIVNSIQNNSTEENDSIIAAQNINEVIKFVKKDKRIKINNSQMKLLYSLQQQILQCNKN